MAKKENEATAVAQEAPATTEKEATNTKKEEQAEKQKAKNEEKKGALVLVLNFITGLDSAPDDVKNAAKVLVPGRSRAPQREKNTTFIKLFGELEIGGAVDEMVLFQEHKVGRAEMRVVTRDLIKKVDKPENRLWVTLDVNKGEYVLIGKGSDAPAGWNGYVPVEIENVEV